jgi:hypothetical protein
LFWSVCFRFCALVFLVLLVLLAVEDEDFMICLIWKERNECNRRVLVEAMLLSNLECRKRSMNLVFGWCRGHGHVLVTKKPSHAPFLETRLLWARRNQWRTLRVVLIPEFE